MLVDYKLESQIKGFASLHDTVKQSGRKNKGGTRSTAQGSNLKKRVSWNPKPPIFLGERHFKKNLFSLKEELFMYMALYVFFIYIKVKKIENDMQRHHKYSVYLKDNMKTDSITDSSPGSS